MKPARPELVFALVGPIGANLEAVESLLRESLATVGYESETIRLSRLLDSLNVWPDDLESRADLPEDERINAYMNAARTAREDTGHDDLLVLEAILHLIEIREEQQRRTGWEPPRAVCPECNHEFDHWVGVPPLTSTAFILNSLKHPEEVRTLRRIYGPGFFLVGVSSKPSDRKSMLVRRIQESRSRQGMPLSESKLAEVAEELMARDIAEEGATSGQRVKDTFHLSDLFVHIKLDSDNHEAREGLSRFISLLFSHPYPTPRRDEFAMFLAHVAATRSSSLARQVGAVLATNEGEILSVGANEMARPGGGLIWDDDPPELRDSDRERGRDTGAVMKDRAALEVWKAAREMLARKAQQLEDSDAATEVNNLLAGITEDQAVGALHNAPILGDTVEFYREVHAEMAALVDASRRGVSVDGATIYVTTYPCHDCAKHLVAAGIRRIVYVEPYPKSRAPEFYPNVFDEEENTSLDESARLEVEPFVGIGPRCYRRLFTLASAEGGSLSRRDKDGYKVKWEESSAGLRWRTWSESYLEYEMILASEFRTVLDEKGLRKLALVDEDVEGEAAGD